MEHQEDVLSERETGISVKVSKHHESLVLPVEDWQKVMDGLEALFTEPSSISQSEEANHSAVQQ